MKESYEFNLAERESAIASSQILEEKENVTTEKTECPYDLNKPYQVTNPDTIIAGSQEAYENFFDALKNKYFDFMYEAEMILQDFQPLPRDFFDDQVVHVMSLENYRILEDDDYFGDNKNNGGVYLQTKDSVVLPNDDTFSEGKMIVRLFIDTDTLFGKGRKIFIDEESITEMPEEYKKSFFMYGGIPRSAIKKIQIIKMGKPKFVQEQIWGNYKQREKEYFRRLQSVRDRLNKVAHTS